MLLAVPHHHSNDINAKKWIFVEDTAARFAAILFDHALSREVQSDPGVQKVGNESARGDENQRRVRHDSKMCKDRDQGKVVVEGRMVVEVVIGDVCGESKDPLLKDSSLTNATVFTSCTT